MPALLAISGVVTCLATFGVVSALAFKRYSIERICVIFAMGLVLSFMQLFAAAN